MNWQANPATDRKVVEAICDRLHVWLQTTGTRNDCWTCLEDVIAIVHASGVADFGETGDAATVLRDARSAS